MDSWPAWVRWILVLPVAATFYAVFWWLLPIVCLGDEWCLPYVDMEFAICSALFVWCGVATAPRFKLLIASLLGVVPLYVVIVEFGRMHPPARIVTLSSGLIVAWGLVLWGYLRRRQAGLASR